MNCPTATLFPASCQKFPAGCPPSVAADTFVTSEPLPANAPAVTVPEKPGLVGKLVLATVPDSCAAGTNPETVLAVPAEVA